MGDHVMETNAKLPLQIVLDRNKRGIPFDIRGQTQRSTITEGKCSGDVA
jgi:hypothetical protein